MIVTLVMLLFVSTGAWARDVVFPDFRGRQEEEVFPYAVLKEALSREDYRLVKSSRAEMTNARAIRALEQGWVDVIWVGTSQRLEERFSPVYVPITRGLLGHRLFVIHEERQDIFSDIDSLDDLRELTGGQGTGWTDTDILREAGLDIVTTSFDNLFRLVEARRIDYYPLGASEVFSFVEEYRPRNPHIRVEDELVLFYKFDFLFFVRTEDGALHRALVTALEEMYRDGTYMEMYNTHPELQGYLDAASLEDRRRFEIENPIATEEFQAIPDRYWMDAAQ